MWISYFKRWTIFIYKATCLVSIAQLTWFLLLRLNHTRMPVPETFASKFESVKTVSLFSQLFLNDTFMNLPACLYDWPLFRTYTCISSLQWTLHASIASYIRCIIYNTCMYAIWSLVHAEPEIDFWEKKHFKVMMIFIRSIAKSLLTHLTILTNDKLMANWSIISN